MRNHQNGRKYKIAMMMAKKYRVKLDGKTNDEIYVVGCEHKLSQYPSEVNVKYKYLACMRWSHDMSHTHTHT